nr:hypothetical protein Itr_chr15CG09900 [Ipomoea trifida]
MSTQSPIDRQPQLDDKRSPGRFGNFQADDFPAFLGGEKETACGVGFGKTGAKAETRNSFSGWLGCSTEKPETRPGEQRKQL